jgi:hypothetical protein
MRRSTGFAALILVWVLAINASAKDTPPVSPPPPNASPGPSLKAGRPEAAPENSQLDTDRLERSRAAWLKAKAACGGDYSYVVRFQSAFGFGHATTITVRDGKVIQRMFEQWSRPEPREQHCSIRDTRIADDAPQRGVPPFELTLDSSNR